LCGVALLRLRGAFCGCDDLTIFEQPEFFNLQVCPNADNLQLPFSIMAKSLTS
jgi:hypothetical protein